MTTLRELIKIVNPLSGVKFFCESNVGTLEAVVKGKVYTLPIPHVVDAGYYKDPYKGEKEVFIYTNRTILICVDKNNDVMWIGNLQSRTLWDVPACKIVHMEN